MISGIVADRVGKKEFFGNDQLDSLFQENTSQGQLDENNLAILSSIPERGKIRRINPKMIPDALMTDSVTMWGLAIAIAATALSGCTGTGRR